MAHSLCSPRGSLRPAGAPTPALTFGGTDRIRTGDPPGLCPPKGSCHLSYCSVCVRFRTRRLTRQRWRTCLSAALVRRRETQAYKKPLRPARRWRQSSGLNGLRPSPSAISPPFSGEVLISLLSCVILPLSISPTVYLPPQVCGPFFIPASWEIQTVPISPRLSDSRPFLPLPRQEILRPRCTSASTP